MRIFNPKKGKLFVLVLMIFFLIPLNVSAQLEELDKVADSAKLGEQRDISAITGKIMGTIFTLTGVFLLILVIIGGIMWMTAGGKEDQVKKAKALFQNAFIGLIIIVLAYAISRFVIENLSKATSKPSKPGPSSSMMLIKYFS
ncbi:MAG: hypothetical protein PHW15_01385 [Patescibacteria group bacterium]|jgi:uncharacterized membrane protein YwzB|nr:hypothetical protein [Patescibacteria group bacterium]MDD5172745.1 hypothetical protein [Patescibacteria group bacterium]